METIETLKAQETARSVVYRRLADAYRPPGPNLPAVPEAIASALIGLGYGASGDAARLARRAAAPSPPAPLQVDYTRLFLGPFMTPAPPYGSVYLEEDRKLMGVSTIDARRHYRSLGLDVSPAIKEAPDHICTELEFMHALIIQGLQALDAADADGLSAAFLHQRTFLENHLGAWVPKFAEKVIAHAGTAFYRDLARLTRRFIAEDMAALPDLDPVEAAPLEATG